MKRYLTGKEIFEAGICTPVELGEKCWEGTITAWDETGAAQYSSRELWEEMRCGAHSWTVIPFPFGMEEYAKECGGPGLAMASEYKSDLSRMLFEVDEVEKAFSAITPQTAGVCENVPLDEGRGTHIPRHLWAGSKTPEQVCEDMRAAGFGDDAIAYALYNWCGIQNKTEIGRVLRGGDLTDIAYRKYASGKLKSLRQWETDR